MEKVLEKDVVNGFMAQLSLLGIEPTSCSSLKIEREWLSSDFPNGVSMGVDIFSDIARIAQSVGDGRLIVADIYSPKSTPFMASCLLAYDEFCDLIASHENFYMFDTLIFGRSMKWLAVLRGLHDGRVFVAPEAVVAVNDGLRELSFTRNGK